MTAQAIALEVTLQVPMAAERPDVQTLDEVATGLVLEVDDAFVPLTPDPDRPPRTRIDGHAMVVQLHLEAPAPPPGVHTLRLSDHNYPDLPGWFAWRALVGPRIEVLEPLQHPGEGWQPGDDHRVLALRLHRHDGPAWRLYGLVEGGLRDVHDGRPRSLPGAWWTGALSPSLLVLLGLLALATGGALGRSLGDDARRGALLGLLAAGLALAVGAAALPSPTWALLLGASGLAVVYLASPPLRAARMALFFVAPATVLASGTTASAALLAVLVGIGIVAGAAAPARQPPVLAGRLAAVLGLLLTLRAAGTWLA